MPRKKLTDAFCRSVTVEDRTDFQDEVVAGLVLRVAPSGRKVWNAIYTAPDGTKPRLNLGKFPAISLEKARLAAMKAATSVAEGDDPAQAKRAAKEGMTVEELGALYIEQYAKPKKRTWGEDERILKKEVYPHIGRKKAASVKRRDIIDIIQAKADAGAGIQSNAILAVIRKMFAWAEHDEKISERFESPCVGIKKRATPVARERVLRHHEIRAIWKALADPETSISAPMRDVIRLLFWTGQRSGEIAGMMRGELDLDQAIWHIPGARTKNKKAHSVPLAPQAITIIEKWLERAEEGRDAPLFSKTDNSFESNAVSKAVRVALQDVADERWTPHDARRTLSTGMGDVDVEPHIVECVTNHVSGFRGGVAGTYNKNKYLPKMREALINWANHFDAILENAVPKK